MIETLTTAMGLGLGAGINSYATLLVFGLLSRFSPSLFDSDLATFFGSTPVLITLGVMYCIEFLADKIPAVDHAWDAIHTFVRPVAGALVAFASITPEMPQGFVILATVVGGSAALGSHALKSSVRGVSTVTTAGTANPFLSVLEDVFAIVQTFLAVLLPWIFLAVLAISLGVVLAWFVGRRTFGTRKGHA